MSLPISFLNIDKIGNQSSNLIQNELHELPYGMMVIKPSYCAYYTVSMNLIGIDDSNNEHPLTRGTHYKCTDIFTELTANTGKEICGSILLSSIVNYTKFKLSYQAYGGFNNPSIRNIYQSLGDLFTEGVVDYADIRNKPKRFNPTPHHLHDWLDIYGLEFIVDQVNLVTEAITNSPNLLDLQIGKRISDLFNAYYNINQTFVDSNHLTAILNPHVVTKDQIGLTDVSNLECVTDYTSTSLTDNFLNDNRLRYINSYSVTSFINEFGNLNKAIYIGGTSTYSNNINSTATVASNNANTAINNMNLTASQNGSAYILNKLNILEPALTTDMNYVKSFKNKYWNKEVTIILNGILNHKYNLDGIVLNIPSKIDNLVSWIDFSDSNTLLVDNLNYITSVTDKATVRTFTNNTGIRQPRLTAISNNNSNQINKNSIARFFNNSKLNLTSGDPIILGKEFTYIALVNTVAGSGILMHNSASDKKIWVNNTTKRGISIDNMLDTTDNISNDNVSVLNILAVNTDNTNSYYTNNISNNTFNNLQTFTITTPLAFDTIGVNTTTITQEVYIAEILIYDRKLATCELNSICKYLNKKWSNTQFSTNIDYIETQL